MNKKCSNCALSFAVGVIFLREALMEKKRKEKLGV